jgi:hypothetical protein
LLSLARMQKELFNLCPGFVTSDRFIQARPAKTKFPRHKEAARLHLIGWTLYLDAFTTVWSFVLTSGPSRPADVDISHSSSARTTWRRGGYGRCEQKWHKQDGRDGRICSAITNLCVTKLRLNMKVGTILMLGHSVRKKPPLFTPFPPTAM